jgi:DNA phosphorothioation-dependent restriction protein DptH
MMMIITPVDDDDLHTFVAKQIKPMLVRALERSGAGQRLRVTSLPAPVMYSLCQELQSDTRWCARVLTNGLPTKPWQVTATKVIELRNTLAQPLVVFIPQGLRNAAEDSLDIATFTELSLASVADQLVDVLLLELDNPLQMAVREVLGRLRLEKMIRHSDEEVRYLLTLKKNGSTPEAAGGAIYQFGLIPDFELFLRGSPIQWLSRNQVLSGFLGDVAQPLQTRIARLRLKPHTIQAELFRYLRSRHADDIRIWARDIACDPSVRSLAFDLWHFSEELNEQELRIILEPLSLPVQAEDKVTDAAQLPILNLVGKDPLRIAFRSIPKPNQYPSWKNFRVQILAVNDEAPSVAWESNNFPRTQGPNARISRSIRIADLQSLEEGTYSMKVEAYDADGALINASPRLVDPNDLTSRAENESERFLVLREDSVTQPEEVRAVFVPSLVDAWMRVVLKNLGGTTREALPDRHGLNGSWDEPIGAAPRADVHFELTNNGFAGFAVAVPSLLRKAELALLQNPSRLGRYQFSLAGARSISDVELKYEATGFLDGIDAKKFLETRADVFQAILRDHIAEGAGPDELALRAGLVETVDLSKYEAEVRAYVGAYCELASHLLNSLGPTEVGARALAMLDVVELRWRASQGDPGRAMLIAPTHPLRLAWHLQHTKFADDRVKAWDNRSESVPSWREFLDQVQHGLLPINLPMVLFDKRGRGYVEQTPLTPFWPLYLPDRVDGDIQLDTTAARDRVLASMGIGDRRIVLSTVSAEDIAGKLYEYINQHPYVEQLRLNIFNPGDGRFIAEVLRALERRRVGVDSRSAPSLRYAVHLFATSDHLDLVANGLEALLDPDRQVGEDDEFTLTSSNHLLPKLVFARNTTDEFLQAPEKYPAHVSILHEQFIAHSRVARIDHLRRGSFVRGLIHEPEVNVENAAPHFGWTKGLRPNAQAGAGEFERDIATALSLAQRLQAAVAMGQTPATNVAPVVALQLDANGQALLRRVHDQSDWVLTIDRNLGLDYFDSPTSNNDAGYLLDFAPEYLREDRQRVLLTTRSTIELENLIRPALERLGLLLQKNDEVVVLEALRSLSGRLALRFESARTQVAEVVGLLLARWLLERVDILAQRIVIPLDAHRGWFGSKEHDATASQKRADLLLVGFDKEQTLRFDIVEVKFRSDLQGAARVQLYKDMHQQAENTEHRLRELFDPDFFAVPRADFQLQAKELGTVLAFYVRRAIRYGLLGTAEGDAALTVIEKLDEGYRLDTRLIGVMFERSGTGVHEDEEEPGFRVHRFGGDVAQRLLAYAVGRHNERTSRLSQSSDLRGSDPPSPPASPPAEPELESFQASVSIRRSVLATKVEITPHIGSGEARPGDKESAVPTPKEPDNTEVNEGAGPDEPSPKPPYVDEPNAASPIFVPDVLLGATEISPQYGALGKAGDQSIAIDLNGCNTISLFGVQGFGKSYTLGVIAEMATTQVDGINVLPSPLATVIFHYHKSDAYEPEHAEAVYPNQKQLEVERLLAQYGARPTGLSDVVLLAPEAKVEQRRQENPDLVVEPIKFSSAELGAESWKFLLGAYGNDSLYVRQLVAIMRRHRGELTLEVFRREIEAADLSKGARQLAEDRLRLAEPYIDDTRLLGSLLRPGRTVIVDLRDEWIEKDEALGLFVIMLRIFAAQKHEMREFNKLVVFDEAHKYMTESALIGQVVETIREMRHQATSIVIASQDPLSVPRAIIELTSILILHRMTSPQWLKHLKSALIALDVITETEVAALKPGEALVWAQRSTEKRFSLRPLKVVIRPRFTKHGGGTRTAVLGATVR